MANSTRNFARLLVCLTWLSILNTWATPLTAQPRDSRIGDVAVAAPNAAALGKYGDIPVSYYTGVPNVGLPLHTLEHGPLSLPISLSYHASGVKVAELASWVGLGWSLQAGGLISRSVQGLPDESTAWGYFNYGGQLSTTDLTKIGQVAYGDRDGEPDLFTISAAGLNAKFYFNKNKEISFLEKTDLKVTYTFDVYFRQFIITNTDGTRYYFGSTPEGATATESTAYSTSPNSAVTSWYLMRIESQDANYQINFTYENESYSYRSPSSCRLQYAQCSGDGTAYTTSLGCSGSADARNAYYTRVDVYGKRLKTITAGPTTVSFSASVARDDLEAYYTQSTKNTFRLESIDISSGDGSYCTRYALGYDYFWDDNGFTTARPEAARLKLTQVQKRECNTTATPTELPTRFTYHGPVRNGKQYLPYRLSKAIDHWGFYNGKSGNEGKELNIPTNSGQLPNGQNHTYTTTVDRNTNETYLKYGVLEQIDYPTGGSTAFAFEANSVYDLQGQATTAPITTQFSTTSSGMGATNCGPIIKSSTQTLPSGSLANAQFVLSGSSVFFSDGTTTCPDNNVRTVKLTARRTSDNALIGVRSYNLSAATPSKFENLPLHQLGIFQGGTSYTFTLETYNAFAYFRIDNTTSTPANLVVGGLRIQEIRSSDGISAANDVVKTYQYPHETIANQSSGLLYNRPRYVYQVQGQAIGWNGGNPVTYDVRALFYVDNSIVPLYSFSGYHVGYKRVKEIYAGNGYVLHEFSTGGGNSTNTSYTDYPRTPTQLDVSAGELRATQTYPQGASSATAGTTYAHTTLAPTSSPGTILVASPVFSCPGGTQTGGTGIAYFYSTYYIPTGAAYRVETKTEVLDGVATVTSYEYDPSNRFLAPTAELVTNSNTAIQKTSYTYPHDLSGNAALRDALLSRNLVAAPIETRVVVGSLQVGGGKLEYSFFKRSDGTVTTTASGADVYPYKFYDYEMTWQGSTAVPGAYVLRGTVNGYHPANEVGSVSKGYPKFYTTANWPVDTFYWKNGQLTERRYKGGYIWKYAYITNTRLLKSITEVDGQVVNFTYDKFGRLKTSVARSGNVTTTYTYGFTNGTLSTSKNYVKSSTIYTGVSNSSLTQRIQWQYFDGLGRLLQTVNQKHSPSGKDVVMGVTYDNLGRQTRVYNPFEATTTTGVFTPLPATTEYTLTGYEASPLSRVTSVTPPDWPYATTTTYSANLLSDDVLKQNSSSSTYDPGLLFKVTVTDPQNNQSITFTDKFGRQVLARRKASTSSTSADTYQYFDNKGRVTTVIPPDATRFSSDLIFTYSYDAADNVLTKKVPDAEEVNYRYTTRDQVALMQDGNLAASNKWLATLYDDYGRVKTTGYWSGTVPGTIAPTTLTITSANELTKAYYDGADGSTTVNLVTSPQYRGKLRKEMVKVLDGGTTWLSSVNTYDAHGRMTAQTGNNYQYTGSATAESHTYTYDWADNPLTHTRVHKPSSSVTRTLAYRNAYDTGGRRSNYFLKIDTGTEQKLANYTYDERDLLKERNLGGTGTGYLQSLDYTYNAQGWLTTINGSSLGGGSVGIKTAPTLPVAPTPSAGADYESNDLFYLALNYDELATSLPATARRDGNISQVIWRTRGRERQAYAADYDYLGRMTTAAYYDLTDANVKSSDQKFREEVTYQDARGNIATLKRNGMYPSGPSWAVGQIDNLTYTTTSGTNKLASISDAAPTAGKAFGFQPGSGAGYDYDKNGNLILDTYKGITDIDYNHLNLPQTITIGSKTITLLYDAAGRKLQKVTSGGASAENYTQYYADGLEYRGTTLEAIYHEEGRVTQKTATTWQFEYSIRDHLGNTRLTFADISGNGKIEVTDAAATNELLQENHYTPFGLQLEYGWVNAPGRDTRYKFNGKEFNEDFGLKLNDYGARWYDPAVARWTSVDPKTNIMPGWSPFNYVFGNPIRLIDPDGTVPEDIIVRLSKVGKQNILDVTVRGKIIDLSSNSTNNLDDIRRDVNSITYFNGGFSFQSANDKMQQLYTMRVTFEFQTVSSMDKIKENDHVIALVDEIPKSAKDKYEIAGMAELDGNVILVEARNITKRLAGHELGHILGLFDNRDLEAKEPLMAYGEGTTVGAPSLRVIGLGVLTKGGTTADVHPGNYTIGAIDPSRGSSFDVKMMVKKMIANSKTKATLKE